MTYKELISKAVDGLLYLNMAGLAVGALYLLQMHGFAAVGLIIIMVAFSRYIVPLLLFPATFCINIMVYCIDQGYKVWEKVMYFLSTSYIVFFFATWVYWIFKFYLVDLSFPGMVLASSAAMLPLIVWVSSDKENLLMLSMVTGVQISTVLASIWLFFHHAKGDLSYWNVMLILVTICMLISYGHEKYVIFKASRK